MPPTAQTAAAGKTAAVPVLAVARVLVAVVSPNAQTQHYWPLLVAVAAAVVMDFLQVLGAQQPMAAAAAAAVVVLVAVPVEHQLTEELVALVARGQALAAMAAAALVTQQPPGLRVVAPLAVRQQARGQALVATPKAMVATAKLQLHLAEAVHQERFSFVTDQAGSTGQANKEWY